MNHEIAVRLLFTLAVIFALAGLGMMIRWAFWGRSESQSRMGVRFGIEAAMLAAIWVPAYLGGVWVMAAVLAACTALARWRWTWCRRRRSRSVEEREAPNS